MADKTEFTWHELQLLIGRSSPMYYMQARSTREWATSVAEGPQAFKTLGEIHVRHHTDLIPELVTRESFAFQEIAVTADNISSSANLSTMEIPSTFREAVCV